MLSDRALEYVSHPRNRGELAGADFDGIAGEPGEGPYVHIWLKVYGSVVAQASFETNGCPSSVAAASALCELARGREMDKLKLLTAEDLVGFLGGLPEGKESYAEMAIRALNVAMESR